MLQVGVALYAYRLNRAFGTSRVGWSIFSAFVLLTLIRFIQAANSAGGSVVMTAQVELIYGIVSLLLMIGMIHIEQVFRARADVESAGQQAREGLEEIIRTKTAELTQMNEDLRREVESREQKERMLKQSEEQYHFLFEENPQPMWVFDRDSLEFLTINNAAIRHYGFSREELKALTARNIRPAQDIPAFIEDVAKTSSGVEPRGVWRHYKKDGAVVDVEIMVTDFVYDYRPARLVLASDITERLALETQLRQVQKMEAIGQFAGGIAHDFNNILTVIQGYSTLLLKRRHDTGTVDQINQISSAAGRGTSLIRQLLAFSRRNVMQFEPTNLNSVVENLSKMLRRLIGEDIVLNTEYGEGLPPIMGDVCMLEQILMNLAANSRDAMPEGGELAISTSLAHIDERHVQRYQEARIGDFARVTVRDSGCGIAPEILTHLFEPFFTTKDVGKGTGLGLATIYGIVQQHTGWIQVNTAVGVGTEFEIYFPVIPNAAPANDGESAPKPIVPGKETILLVEDEAPVRGLAQSILEENGYRVIEADCGSAALALWEKQGSNIDLVLTDLIMPGGISGRDLADTLRKRRPNLKIVYMSGYSPTRSGADPKMTNGLKFLPKPYNPDNLIRVIQDCLHSAC